MCGKYILLEEVYEISLNVFKGRLPVHKKCHDLVKEASESDDFVGNLPEGKLKKALMELQNKEEKSEVPA